eukprot:TRINITY_DN93623_c0_g1_i1.p1 TRINITY_DN93623_c0_g1~~TRINITY_DN93623_c0_g1_i1.p1  ORF type:complete len:304 (+),score=66.34 TRINITY_DN93623_c0_g1_i1:108-1019(+)
MPLQANVRDMKAEATTTDDSSSTSSGSDTATERDSGDFCLRSRWPLRISLLVGGVVLVAGAACTRSWTTPFTEEDEVVHKAEEPEFRSMAPQFTDKASSCLCIFDVDRTLTAKQGWESQCNSSEEMSGIYDSAYSRGTLLVSGLGIHVNDTFCKSCFSGVVSHGTASGEKEHDVIFDAIGGKEHAMTEDWQYVGFKDGVPVTSSLILQVLDGRKQLYVRGMVDWFKEKHNIEFRDEHVYFFDDIAENVKAFEGTGFNARQVSCASRGPADPGSPPGRIGGCGGLPEEIVQEPGVKCCKEDCSF